MNYKKTVCVLATAMMLPALTLQAEESLVKLQDDWKEMRSKLFFYKRHPLLSPMDATAKERVVAYFTRVKKYIKEAPLDAGSQKDKIEIARKLEASYKKLINAVYKVYQAAVKPELAPTDKERGILYNLDDSIKRLPKEKSSKLLKNMKSMLQGVIIIHPEEALSPLSAPTQKIALDEKELADTARLDANKERHALLAFLADELDVAIRLVKDDAFAVQQAVQAAQS